MQRLLWLGAVLLGIASKELVQWLRRFDVDSGVRLLLDTYPNFAGVVVAICCGMAFRPPAHAGPDRERWFSGWVAGSCLAFVVWELIQLRTALVFDPRDLAATLLGGIVAVALRRATRGAQSATAYPAASLRNAST